MAARPEAPAGRRNPAGLPRFLDLSAIRFPVGAIASIGHRLSGACLVLAMPWLPDMLARSLRSQDDYDVLLGTWRSPWMAPLEFLILWAFCYHVLAGLRHLLMDVGVGAGLRAARTSARIVLGLGFAVALVLLVARRLP